MEPQTNTTAVNNETKDSTYFEKYTKFIKTLWLQIKCGELTEKILNTNFQWKLYLLQTLNLLFQKLKYKFTIYISSEADDHEWCFELYEVKNE